MSVTESGLRFAAPSTADGNAATERKGTNCDQDNTPANLHEGPSAAISKGNGIESAGGPEGVSKPRALNPTRFLCRSEVRNFLLQHAEWTRSHKFSRVSEETLV